jgi:hypothetical protein
MHEVCFSSGLYFWRDEHCNEQIMKALNMPFDLGQIVSVDFSKILALQFFYPNKFSE